MRFPAFISARRRSRRRITLVFLAGRQKTSMNSAPLSIGRSPATDPTVIEAFIDAGAYSATVFD